jgi:hypothetical protein
MGFRAESRGLFDRYINVEGAWEEHLERTHGFIARVVQGRKFDNMAVLGSGWLLDVPLELLAQISGHVRLYDAIHPPQVIHRLREFPNVTAVSADITGGVLKNTFQAVRDYKKHRIVWTPEQICGGDFKPEPVPDFVISLNLLSQIGVMITDYLVKYIPLAREETDRLNLLLQQSHLRLLPPGKSCLVTDIIEKNTDLENGTTETTGLIDFSLPDAASRETWEWQFDPVGGYRAGKKTVMQVVALEF